jgi:hypothetical protein
LVISGSTYVLTTLLSGITNSSYPWGADSVGEFIIFVNNRTVVYNEDVVGQNKAFVEHTTGNIPIARDICNYNAQLIVAAPWMYGQQHPGCIATSRVANADFTLSRVNITELVPVDHCGNILRVLATERGFIAYGSKGVAEFIAQQNEYSNLVAPTFTQVFLKEVGLYSQLAVYAAPGHHCYVGSDLMLREITPKGVETLDFNHILKETPGEIVMNYDEVMEEFYITY